MINAGVFYAQNWQLNPRQPEQLGRRVMPATSRGTRRALAIAGTAALASAALPALPIHVPELYHLHGNSTALNATALNATVLNATALNALKATALRPLPRVVAPHVGVALPGAVALHAPGRPLAAVARRSRPA